MKNWTTVLAQTDVRDPEINKPLYAYAKVRPRWYWTLRRLKLFLGIVWRKWDEGYRLSWSTAWEVSEVAKGLTQV